MIASESQKEEKSLFFPLFVCYISQAVLDIQVKSIRIRIDIIKVKACTNELNYGVSVLITVLSIKIKLTILALRDPWGATFKLLPCLRGAATKWLRGGSATRDLLLQNSR